MCSADTTLEKAIVTDSGQIVKVVDGWDVTHQCRDWESLTRYVLEHQDPTT